MLGMVGYGHMNIFLELDGFGVWQNNLCLNQREFCHGGNASTVNLTIVVPV
jgi:hypothetical protein